MKIIKKMSKSLCAFAMAIAMLMSGNVNAYAAELDGDSVTKETTVEVAASEDNFVENTAIKWDGDMSRLITPRYTGYLNNSASNFNVNSKYSDNFTMTRTEKLYVRLNVQGSCHIKVTFKKGLVWHTFLDADVTNEDALWYSPNTVEQGMQVYVTITSKQNNSSYSLNMYGQ